jgi:hypothetical protein
MDDAVVEINIGRPSQGEQFALPEVRRDRDVNERTMPIMVHELQEGPDLVELERLGPRSGFTPGIW